METTNLLNTNKIEDRVSTFELNFHFFKIRGKADPAARDIFNAINEHNRLMPNPYFLLESALDKENRALIDAARLRLQNNENDIGAYIDIGAILNGFALKNGLPTIPVLESNAQEALISGKAVNINKLFWGIYVEAVRNGSYEIEFTAQNDEDGISIEEKKKLSEAMAGSGGFINMINLVCDTYKKDFDTIYTSILGSVERFLAKFK